ncbi:MAG TPA: SH3 domain-containing protein [Vicinamibacteria bacterium]|nr:SH3 domain-containing protein [Vicinamibacteria bacterium]
MPTRFRRFASLVLTLSLAAGGSWADSVRVEAARVNVRKDPNTASAIVTTVGRGEALEVIERSGDWYHVKTAAGVEGYVSARLVAPVTPAAAAPSARAATPAAAAPMPAPSPWKGDRPVIVHQDVGCVVAGEFPKLEACFTPPESVGKAQVQFRADEKGPWYYVDMKEEGGCRSALLPKPKKDIGTFHYFIEVVDRSFTAVQKPEAAPSQSYAPRVVANRRECGQGMMMATGTPTGSVVMGVARDAGGKVLQAAAAHSAETTASISGFSADGVSMASTGAAPGSSAGAGSSSTAQSAGGISTKTLVIAGGVVGAGALVAVAAGGGGGGSGSGGSSGSSGGGGGGGSTAPGGGTTTNTLTGRWVGNAANGGGLTGVVSLEGVTCTVLWDLTTDLVQSGTTLTGTGTSIGRGASCSIPLPSEINAVIAGQTGSGSLSGSASNGTLSFRVGELTFTGTYTSTRLDATAPLVVEGLTITYTWRQTKQ